MDEMPISGNKGMSNDDLPIGGGNKFAANDADGLEDAPIKKGAYNLDNLGDDAFGGGPMPSNDNKPKKILPKIAAKPKEEEKKALPAKAVAATGGNKGAQVLEEDVGAGLSKEEAEAKVAENFPPEVVACIEDTNKWNEKVEGYKGMASHMVSL